MARRRPVLIPVLSGVALALALALAALLAGATAIARTTAAQPAALHAVKIGMGYIPSVQFAPFYVAQQRGYYRQAGLNVTFDYAQSPTLLQIVGAGHEDFAVADGTDAIAAVDGGVPLTYVMAEYQRFPVAIFALRKSGIRSVHGLRGKTVGVAGRYGATYTGLLAALHSAGLTLNDVHVTTIGYTQVESVAAGRVDAAVGYSVNEPVRLAALGYKVTTLEVSAEADLVAPGIVTSVQEATHNPAVVRAFVQATLRGLADTIANPKAAFAISRQTGGLMLSGNDIAVQYDVLKRAIDFWHGAGTKVHGLGYVDPVQWSASAKLLHLLTPSTPATLPKTAYTNTFVAGSKKV